MDRYAEPRGAVWVDILVGQDRRKLSEFALVLDARAIPNTTTYDRGDHRLAVLDSDVETALVELHEYERENARPVGGPRPIAYAGSGWRGVFFYIAILLVVAIMLHQGAWGVNWLVAGRSDAGAITAGQWWRTVTALCLHVDFVHLAGNLGFGSFFGYFVGRYLGAGVGWLAIVLTGALGNAFNALVQSPDHLAIGASTAVFAALGILSSFTWRRGYLKRTPWRVRFAPITAGIALLAFTGTGGENTDLGAHLFGFVAGFGGGAVLATLNLRAGAGAQTLAGMVAGLLLTVAWAFALSADSTPA